MGRARIPGETPASVALRRRYRHYRPRFITGIAPMDLESAEAVAAQLRGMAVPGRWMRSR